MEKIDTNKLGWKEVERDKDGRFSTIIFEPQKAITDVANKINEIIDYLNKNEEDLLKKFTDNWKKQAEDLM